MTSIGRDSSRAGLQGERAWYRVGVAACRMAGSPGTIAAGSPFQQIWRRSETMSVIRSLLAELAPWALLRRRPVAEPAGKPDTRQPGTGSPRKKRDEANVTPSTTGAPQPEDPAQYSRQPEPWAASGLNDAKADGRTD